MKKTKIEIKIPKSIVYCGNYCSEECDFFISYESPNFAETKCLLFKKFIKWEGMGKPVRCDDCKERH